jgi:hypothetical protein
MSHKGSWSRVNNHKDWADNYEQIFRKKPNQIEEVTKTTTQTKQKHEHTTKHNEEDRSMAPTRSQTNSNASP